MSRKFTMVVPDIWDSPRFLGVSSDGKVLLFYYMTGKHMKSSGCASMREGYALADLGWDAKRYRAARKELAEAELVSFDCDETYVERWFLHCAPNNMKHALGTYAEICRITSDALRERAEADFAATDWGGKFLVSPYDAG